ncbi:nitrate reductase [Serratia sp. BIGb0163]|uniref:nitrate reductase n=1 Tax=Serratia sp. BIGb0163 TaxID=2940613 RepID=UPI002166D1B3|nr:nitrate reductase [Serratia sp. BIGb0163]MCS4266127.1 assimilatory nitrate reductase catalytic subunit [Serratia sp. BIGb0163]
MSAVHCTTCPYCGVGCGVAIEQHSNGELTVGGDVTHPANQGRLCVKGSALGETLSLTGRLLQPQVDGLPVSWDQALEQVAQRFSQIIEQYGPQAVAFYASGQLLTEDYYVANKLMKGFIGAANIDTNSRLCMASAVVGYKRAFGGDVVPCCYEDIEQADLVILTGSNTAWAHPVVYQRLVKARKLRPQMWVVVIDPRETATCDIADLHLPLRPGSDAALFTGGLHWLAEQQALDTAFLQRHASGTEATLAAAADWTPQRVADFCELPLSAVLAFFHLLTASRNWVTLYSMGINQSASGSDKCNAIINLHLAGGRIGRAGSGPFSITGQPNAMGGREVGGLANQLAAHMSFNSEDTDRVQRFWRSPRIAQQPGLNAVDLFQAIAAGQVKAVWIMGTNPVVSLPDADAVRQALKNCPLVVVSEVMAMTDTAELAHIRLPALAWGEKEGSVTNSERCISRQRAFLPAPGQARADWWILSQVAQRMGYGTAFGYQHPSEIFSEHAALSGFENNGTRAFDISQLAGWDLQQWLQMAPVQWPVNTRHPVGCRRMFDDGRFFHADGKARLLPVTPRLPQNALSPGYPLVLNTGRIRDQWHTMTRTGKAARLMRHLSEPFCEIHPQDAVELGIADSSLVRLSSPHGWMLARALYHPGQRRGSLFAPMHWNGQFTAQGRVDSLIPPIVDADSGQPESKHAPVRASHWPTSWQAEIFIRAEVAAPKGIYWSRVAQDGLTHYIMAGQRPIEDWQAWLQRHFSLEGMTLQTAQLAQRGLHLIGWRQGEVQLAFYVRQQAPQLDRPAILRAFEQAPTAGAERLALLAGRGAPGQSAAGATICSCFGVGENRIIAAIQAGCHSAEALGARLQCGTNCGSCLPELKKLIQQHASQRVA